MFEAERPSLLAALGLAAQRGWDEQVLRLSESIGGSLMVLRYLDDLLTVREAALAAARHAEEYPRRGQGAERPRRGLPGAAAVRGGHRLLRAGAGDLRGDRHGEGMTLNNLGIAYVELRRFEEAIGCYEQSLAICEETGDRHGEGMTLSNLGIAYRELRRFEEAIDCLPAVAGDQAEDRRPVRRGQTLNNLGILYRAAAAV